MIIEKIVELGEFERSADSSSSYTSRDDCFKVEEPHYVTNWLMALLAGEKVPVSEVQFHAKIHDRAITDGERSRAIPWRRSREYFAVKYVLKQYLTWHLGPVHGILAYKSIILLILVQLAEVTVDVLDVDMGIQLMTKIARRMKKLQVSKNEFDEETTNGMRADDISNLFERGLF